MFKFFISLVIVGPCVGCAAFSPLDVARPSDVTVENALADIGSGFSSMKKNLRKDGVVLGLYACKVTVALDVTASAYQGGSGKLVLNANTGPTVVSSSMSSAQVDGNVTVEQKNDSNASRGNKIIVEMYSPACVPSGTVGYEKPEKVAALAKAMRGEGSIGPFSNRRQVLGGSSRARDGDVTVFSRKRKNNDVQFMRRLKNNDDPQFMVR